MVIDLFRPPPQRELPQKVVIGHAVARWDTMDPFVRTVPSPVNPSKHYHEFNILFANSISFGTNDAELSMIAMHTVEADGRVRLMLNLDRKELDIQFPLEVGGKMRNLRFRLPIALLSHIYKDANQGPGQTALIIPFNSPPQFFIRKAEGEKLTNGELHTSFSSNERLWNEWNAWFRETDVVNGSFKQTLQHMPLMNHKDTAIIDIGKSLSSSRVRIH